jgi:PAP2 superfamily
MTVGSRVQYLDRMRKVSPGSSLLNGQATKLGMTAVGGVAAAVFVGWATGKMLQSEVVVRPSRKVYYQVRDHRSAEVSRRLEQFVTPLGDHSVIVPFSFLVGGLVAYQRRDWRPLPLLVSGLVAEVGLQKTLKRLVKGPVPAEEDSVGPPGDFPSGGAARALITFGLLARLLGEEWNSPSERMTLWGVALGLVAAQGSSRIYLGRHWPEDVLGGWLFGWLILRTLNRAADLTRPARHA